MDSWASRLIFELDICEVNYYLISFLTEHNLFKRTASSDDYSRDQAMSFVKLPHMILNTPASLSRDASSNENVVSDNVARKMVDRYGQNA